MKGEDKYALEYIVWRRYTAVKNLESWRMVSLSDSLKIDIENSEAETANAGKRWIYRG